MSVYVDTSAFLAILNDQDPQHESAARAWLHMVDSGDSIVTSNYVVVETTALLQARHGIPAVRRFSQDVLGVVVIEWVDASIHKAALSAVLASSGSQSPSLVDCVSFEVIQRNRIRDVFAYDRHFQGRGFDLIG